MKELELPLTTAVHLLVLIGGGEFSFGETKEIDEYLLARMPHGNKRVAFLPTASGSAEYAAHFGKYLQTIDPDVETINVPVYRGRDTRRQRNLDQILSSGMIYLGGGVANQLMATLRESAAELAMREAASGGAVVAAIGAAAASFGSWTGGPMQALGWLPGVVVESGFDPADDTNLRRLMSIPEVTLGVGIPARTALAIHGSGRTEIVGEGQIAVVRKG
ncbi:MAG TPA: Type 1 glutamine amidotransferase-like domain-containing protein [Thermoanaerobaculia bacterium]|nr:Type 1 glutamine amidotransferase-like domain-containing protein [Thermoanaerobaculia bacterium]